MAEICWVLTYPSGDDAVDGDNAVPHFRTEAIARERADTYLVPGLGAPQPRRLDRPCVTVACGCCEYTLDEEEGVFHFSDLDEAETTAPGYGWRRGADGSWRCETCTQGPCDMEADTHG